MIALLGEGSTEETFYADAGGFPVRMAVGTPERVRRLTRHFCVVFCTSWGAGASEHIAPLLGLPETTPYIAFDRHEDVPVGATWKLDAVSTFVRDRPCAWVDDEIGDDVKAWARFRVPATHLIRCDPRIGLTREHVSELLAGGPAGIGSRAPRAHEKRSR